MISPEAEAPYGETSINHTRFRSAAGFAGFPNFLFPAGYFASATIVFTFAVVPPPTSTSTMKVPVSRIGSSRRIFFRSTLSPRAAWIASAISAEVTEPKSLPSSPARWLIVRTVFPSRPAVSSARSAAFLGGRGALASPPGLLEEASVAAAPASAVPGSCGGSPAYLDRVAGLAESFDVLSSTAWAIR